MLPIIVLLVIGGLLALILIAMYNRLVRLRQNVRESWSAIDTELRRRYDLIPNLVETVKGYASHERETLEAVIKARNAAVANTGTPAEQAQTETMLSGALRQLFALSEAYPQLRANENFQQLQAQLEETETRISQSRRFYNANVRELNTAVETFPSVLIAGAFGFRPEQYFEIEDAAARGPVAVKF
ncbi:MAG: LemA family protein [Armatimonadota bacterium]|nr:LemA family protein [Armatimonadota bacterium]